MSPRVVHQQPPQRPSRLIQAGVITLILQFLALIFFAGQFFERQSAVDESMKIVKEQHAQMLSDLAVLKASQIEQNRRLDLIEEIEREEGHERMLNRK